MSVSKNRVHSVFSSFTLGNDTFTNSLTDSLQHLVTTLLPDDDPSTDSPIQGIWREDFCNFPGSFAPFGYEVNEAFYDFLISNVKNKAPGWDALRGSFIKKIDYLVKPFIVHIFNSCLRVAYFPNVWKIGNLTILLKSPHGNVANIKNYYTNNFAA